MIAKEIKAEHPNFPFAAFASFAVKSFWQIAEC